MYNDSFTIKWVFQILSLIKYDSINYSPCFKEKNQTISGDGGSRSVTAKILLLNRLQK